MSVTNPLSQRPDTSLHTQPELLQQSALLDRDPDLVFSIDIYIYYTLSTVYTIYTICSIYTRYVSPLPRSAREVRPCLVSAYLRMEGRASNTGITLPDLGQCGD